MSQLFPIDNDTSLESDSQLPQPRPLPPLFVKRRLKTPIRDQMVMRTESLDQELPDDHPVRFVWKLVEQLDFSPWLKLLKAVEGRPGRRGIDPKLLLAIWVQGTVRRAPFKVRARPGESMTTAPCTSPIAGSAGEWE